MKKFIYILLFLFICSSGWARDLRIIEKQPDRLRLQLSVDTPDIQKIVQNDSVRSALSYSDWPIFQDQQGRTLPYKSILIHLNSRHATVHLLSARKERLPLDAPPMTMTESVVGLDSSITLMPHNAFLNRTNPANLVSVDYVGQFKQAQLLRVSVFPFQYDAASRELFYYTNIVFDIVAQPDGSPSQPMSANDVQLLDNLGVISSGAVQKARQQPRLAKKSADNIQRWKLMVNKDGIYRVTGRDLAEAGVRLLDIDFKKLRLTSFGKDVSIYTKGWRDGQFNTDDYFEFWGEFNRQTFQSKAPDMYQDPHTKNRVYWLSWEKRGVWMVEESGEISDVQPGQSIRPYSYLETVHIEEDNYYDHLSNVALDTLRDHWFFDRGITAGKKVDYRFDLWHPDNQSPLRVTARALLSGSTTIVGSAHDVSLYLNNSFIASHQWFLQNRADLKNKENSFINGADVTHGENTLSVVNNVNPQKIDNVLLNWFEITYPRLYRARRDFIKFKIPPDQTNGNFLFRVDGFVDPDIDIYKIRQSKVVGGQVKEVTDFQDFTSLQISFQNDVLYPEIEYVAVSNSAKLTPFAIEEDEPSRLMDTHLAADYIIISHDKFIDSPSVDKLIDLRQAQGYHALKVNVQDIYDEFSYGHVSSYAIRDFIKWAYDQWPEPRLRHVFLLGDGCFVQVSSAGDTLDYIPVHMRQTMSFGSAASDYWYSLVSGQDEIPDVNIGRLPVKTTVELEAALTKIITYETAPPPGDWPNRFLIIGGNGVTFRSQGTALSKIIPPRFDTRLLFSLKDKMLDTDPWFGGTSDLLDYLDQGCSVVTFHGHGGGAIWADNNLLRLEDVNRFYTQGKLPFILSMTCYTGSFEDPNREQSLADALLFTEYEGAVAMVGASGVGWEWNDYFLQTEFMKSIYKNPGITLGDAVTAGKISYLSHYKTSQAVSQVNQYHLLGDPATRLFLPEYQVALQIDDPILLKGDSVTVSTILPFAQGVGRFSVQDSIKAIVEDAQVSVENNSAATTLQIGKDFIGESGLIRFYGADDFGANRVHGAIAISLKGAVFDSAYVYRSPDDSLYFYAHIRSREPLTKLWCLALNDSLDMQPTENHWYKSTRAVTVVWTGFQFSYYFYAVDQSLKSYTSPLYKHYINLNVDVAIDQDDLVFTGRDLVYLEATINNSSSNDVERLPVLYEYRTPENEAWRTIGYDTVNVDAYASFKSKYHYAPAPGPMTVRITLDPDSTMREDNRLNNVLVKSLSPSIFQCNSRGFLLNGEHANNLKFDDNMSIELPVGAITGNSAVRIDTLEQVTIIQQPDYTYIANTPAYDIRLLEPNISLDKSATVILKMPEDSTGVDSLSTTLNLFRFSKQTKKWVKCDTEFDSSTLFAELPDIGPVALLSASDSQPPDIILAIDGQPYVRGKWAGKEPRIGVRLQDVNGIDISIGRMDFVMNGKTIDATELALPDSIIDGNQILISYNPQLQPGEQVLSIQAVDCNQNYSERHEFVFRVANNFDIQMLGNYPNPFTKDTRFVYIFTSPVSDMSLKVFTASGRLIRNFEPQDVYDDPNPLSADYHEVYWDGADAEGYTVANGVYFYKLSATIDGKTKSITGKIAKIK